MTSSSCAPMEAVFKIPVELWLRIALYASSDTISVHPDRKQALTIPLDTSSAIRYNIPSSNLTPGSAPLTPLGPVSGSVSDVGTQDRTLSTDYFSLQTIRSRRGSRDDDGSSDIGVSHRTDNLFMSNNHAIELLARGVTASGAATPSISLGLPPLGNDDLLSWKADPRSLTSEQAALAPRELLCALSRTCRHLRGLIWPYITGTLSIPLAVLQSGSFDIQKELTDRVTLLPRHVRDLEISISPTDDFRASKMMRLLEHLGESLDTFVLRLQSRSNGTPTDLPAHYQLANVPSGMFLPSPSAQSEPNCVLLPKLARLRILSQGNASASIAAGNLPSLLAHSSELLEIDLSGAPMNLGTFMTAVEQLASHKKSLEVLHLNLHKPRLASLGSTDVDDHRIAIALDWLLDCCGTLPRLQDFSMSSFGGVEIIQETQWKSLAQRIRANCPLLRSLSLPLAPFSPDNIDIASQCAAAVGLLTSESMWPKVGIAASQRTPPALADLERVKFKLTSRVERVVGMSPDGQGNAEEDSHHSDWQRLPLTEFGEMWHGSIMRDSEVTASPTVIGRSMPFANS